MPGALNELMLRNAGAFGLNTEESLAVQDPRWLIEAQNLVYDDSGRLASRKGLTALTTTGAHSSATEAIHEYISDATTTEIISAGGNKIYSGTTTLSDITGTLGNFTNDWQFVNFNGKCVGFLSGLDPVVYNGTGTFANILAASGSVPGGRVGLSAFGRLWSTDSGKTTLKWCASLDETHWATGAGSLDTLTVWPDGIDEIEALAEFQDQLLIFGQRSILVYTGAEDPNSDPGPFELVDIIRKGTKWRDSVVPAGRDLLFISDDGIRSVSRGLASQNMPLSDLSSQVRTKLVTQLDDATLVQGAYSPIDRAYLLRIKQVDTEFFWYFDLAQRLETGDMRAIEWSGIGWQSIAIGSDSTVYLGTTGKVADHSGYQDDGSSYSAAWLTAGASVEGGEKILKTASMQITATAPTTVNIRWQVDLDGIELSQSVPVNILSDPSEWNIAEWGLDEWSGLISATRKVQVPMTRSGSIIQLGARITIDGTRIAFSNARVLFKVGRIAA